MWVPAQIHIFVELYTSEPAMICIHHMEIYTYLDCYRLTVPAHMSIFIIWYSVWIVNNTIHSHQLGALHILSDTFLTHSIFSPAIQK